MSFTLDGYPYANNSQTNIQALGLAIQGSTVYYFSAAGPGTACKSIWSSLVSPRHTIDCRPWGYDLAGAGRLQTAYQALPNSNYQHIVSLYKGANFLIVADPVAAQFYDEFELDHVTERKRMLDAYLPTLYTRFAEYLNTQTNVPILRSWAAPLWEAGLADGGISVLDTFGDCLGAWLINNEYDWLAVVQEALQSGKISFLCPPVVPTLQPTPTVEPTSSPTNHTAVSQSMLLA